MSFSSGGILFDRTLQKLLLQVSTRLPLSPEKIAFVVDLGYVLLNQNF